jgi:hypothetical protein
VLKADSNSDLLTGIRAVLCGQQFVSRSLKGWRTPQIRRVGVEPRFYSIRPMSKRRINKPASVSYWRFDLGLFAPLVSGIDLFLRPDFLKFSFEANWLAACSAASMAASISCARGFNQKGDMLACLGVPGVESSSTVIVSKAGVLSVIRVVCASPNWS